MGELEPQENKNQRTFQLFGIDLFALFQNRMMQIAIVVVALLFILVIGFAIRASFTSKTAKPESVVDYRRLKYQVVFEALTPMDAANIRKALSYEKIPFRSVKKGRFINIEVPKRYTDDARLKMAQLGLPAGGIVGFEIFDESANLGATDYDRRIKYIRAISGELSRTMSHMSAVASARVQIVIPEKTPFGDRAPGSASVVLTIKPNKKVTDKQVRGVMHLVASSVEDIIPQDVTVLDQEGNVLSEYIKNSFVEKKQEKVVKTIAGEKKTTSQLDLLLEFKNTLQENTEKKYVERIKDVLSSLYPLNSYTVFVNVSFVETTEKVAPYKISKIKVSILLDAGNENIILTNQLKMSTYSLVASVIDYVKGRDSIVLEKVPFVKADSLKKSSLFFDTEEEAYDDRDNNSLMFKFIYVFVVITVIFIFIMLRFFNYQRTDSVEDVSTEELLQQEREGAVDDIQLEKEKFRNFVINNEDLFINTLVKWLEQ